ncbi:MAG: AraC family transcriptional regulator [Bacillota bacterium]|nr:AraC family transcriptional regulator [Bacillota bacterium]
MESKAISKTFSNEELSPRLLKSIFFTQGANLPKGHLLRERYVYDYEFELMVFSEGSMVIEDKTYDIAQGDLIFRKPGQYTQGIMPYSCYYICVDIIGNTGKSPFNYDIYKEQSYQNYCINPILESIPTIFHPPHIEKYQFLFDSILKEFITASPGSELILKSYVLNLIYLLYQDCTNPLINRTVPLSPHYGIIKKVIEYIDENIERKIQLSDLSALSGLSPNHFHNIFTKTMGLTPNVFITKVRLDKAKEYLTRTDLPISEISLKCGFDNIPYFSHIFKKQLNLSPGEFRKMHSYI